jgi:hypothetical protein
LLESHLFFLLKISDLGKGLEEAIEQSSVKWIVLSEVSLEVLEMILHFFLMVPDWNVKNSVRNGFLEHTHLVVEVYEVKSADEIILDFQKSRF